MKSTIPHTGETKIQTTQAKGNYVYLSFSRAANTVYLGRSYSSEEEAVTNAVSKCSYSDCKSCFAKNHDGCVAFAINNDKLRRWSAGYGANAEDASAVALNYCNAPLKTANCFVVVTHCPDY